MSPKPPFLPVPGHSQVRHVSKALSVCRATIWSWAKQGKFPKPKKLVGITVWDNRDVNAWLEAQE